MKDLIKKLDPFSKRFAKFLFRAFPDWKRYLSVKPFNEDSEAGYLLVNVPIPAKGLKFIADDRDYLTISSNGEVIVSFDFYHDHFDIFSEKENFNNAVEFIKEILNQEICAAAVFSEDKWRASTKVRAGEMPDLSYYLDCSPTSHEIYIRSWRGTYDQKI